MFNRQNHMIISLKKSIILCIFFDYFKSSCTIIFSVNKKIIRVIFSEIYILGILMYKDFESNLKFVTCQ